MKKYKRAAVFMLLVLLSLTLTGCLFGGETADIGKAVELDLGGSVLVRSEDSHGCFLGDGQLVALLDCSAAPLTDTIKSHPHWHALPLTEPLTRLLIAQSDGNGLNAPTFTDEDGRALLPDIRNGYYFFKDRHAEADNVYDDTGLEERYSYNFTVAVYDTDTNKLYYCKIDT